MSTATLEADCNPVKVIRNQASHFDSCAIRGLASDDVGVIFSTYHALLAMMTPDDGHDGRGSMNAGRATPSYVAALGQSTSIHSL